MELKEIQNLIKFVAKSGVNEVHVEMGETKVTIKTGGDVVQQVVTAPAATEVATPAAPVAAPAPAVEPAPSAPAAATTENDNHITIKSPIIGTFYRKPSPDKPNFVEAGDQVNTGDVLCVCLLYTSPSPRDRQKYRMPSSA